MSTVLPLPHRFPRTTIAGLMTVAALVLFVAQAWLYVDWFVDDAAISFTYSRSLANGFGLVLFPHGERVEGYSNPSWVFLLAAASALGLDVFVAAKALSVVAGVAILIGLVRAGSCLAADGARAAPDGRGIAALVGPAAALLTATHPPFVIWCTSGLEGGLYTALLVWSFVLLAEPRSIRRRVPWSALTLMLAALTRPEGAAYFMGALGIGAVDVWLRRAADRRAATRSLVCWVAAFAVPFAAYQLWHYSYFADFVANTFYAKRPPTLLAARFFDLRSPGWNYIRGWKNEYHLTCALGLAASSAIAGVRRGRSAIRLFTFGAVTGLAFAIYADGDWMREWRFIAPATPCIFLLAVDGLALAADYIARHLARPGGSRITAIAVCLGAAVTLGPTLFVTRAAALRFAAAPETGVADVKRRADFFRECRRQLALDGPATLLDPDLGATSFYSGLNVVDTWGLGNVPFAMHGRVQAFPVDYVLDDLRPELAHVFGYWNAQTHLLDDPRWSTDYTPLPAYRMRNGALDGGNWVRRDLLRASAVERSRMVGAPLVTYASGLELLAAEPDLRSARRHMAVTVTLYWRASRSTTADVLFRTRLRREGAPDLVADHPPIHGWLPPSSWIPGEVLKESVRFELSEGAPDGVYQLAVDVVPRSTPDDPEPKIESSEQGPVTVTFDPRAAEVEAGTMTIASEAAEASMDFETACAKARAAASLDSRLTSRAARCADRWRAHVLRAIEVSVSERDWAEAARQYRVAYWRWVDDPAVIDLGRGLARECVLKARHEIAAGAPERAFLSSMRALVFDPTRSDVRRAAERLRMRASSADAETEPARSWVKGIALGEGAGMGIVAGEPAYAPGAPLTCQVRWNRSEAHETEWTWIDPEGNRVFHQRQRTEPATPMSYSFVHILDSPGEWKVDVKVDGALAGAAHFAVQRRAHGAQLPSALTMR